MEIRPCDLLHDAAIIKHHGGAMDLLHIWFENYRPGQNPERQIVIDHWDLTEESNEVAEEIRADNKEVKGIGGENNESKTFPVFQMHFN